MRLNCSCLMRSKKYWLKSVCGFAFAAIGVVALIGELVSPASSQTMPSALGETAQQRKLSGRGQPEVLDELGRERFRRKAAEDAQKQLEVLADNLRAQLAEEIKARQAAEAVASELLSRATLEAQIDGERQRLRASGKTAAPNRAAASGEVSHLKELIDDLRRRLRAAEWARKLAETQLQVMTGDRTR